MNILWLLIPIALTLGALFVFAFIWAVRHDQYSSLDTDAIRMLNDDPPEKST